MEGRAQALDVVADRLRQAETTSTAIAPIAAEVPGLTVAEAYAIQLRNIGAKLAAGDRVTGKKIGLTSPAMQDLLGVHQPDYGHLLASMDVTGEVVATSSLVQPRIEAEIAFVLSADLPTSGVTAADVLAATECVVAALEIVDSRVSDWRIGILDTVADNASSGRYVLGATRCDPRELDLTELTMTLSSNGVEVNSGTGAAVLGDPANAVAWLANAVGQYGVRLNRGEVVLSGAIAAMIPVKAGDVVTARFDTLGEVSAAFS